MKYCPGGGMADTLVLEASAARRESSSLSWGTIQFESNKKGALSAFLFFELI